MQGVPTITLDTTLTELYQRASPENAHQRIGQVLCGTNSAINLTDHFPRNVKLVYQDTSFNTVPKNDLSDNNTPLQRSLATKMLLLVPQREAFMCGPTTVYFFNVDQSPEQVEHDRSEAEKTLGVLTQEQRPQVIFCEGPAEMPLRKCNVDMIAYKLALDALKDYAVTCELEKQWRLNSKEGLARSGLPTPACDIVTLEGYSAPSSACCDICKASELLYIPTECIGSRRQWVNASVDRVISAIQSRSLPFVVKNQQTFGGAGTWVITSETDRQALIRDFSSSLLRKLFSQVTAENQHLKPGSVLLSEIVKDPIGDYGLTFFMCEDGSAIFLAVSEQQINSSNAWIGSTIDYTQQPTLQEKFTPIMNEIAKWLHSYGYFGPVGADILETRPTNGETNPMANMHIVDLNVRTTGSMCLPLLKTHFTKGGFNHSSSFSITVHSTRDEFIEQWATEFESGRICILSWYHDREAGVSLADVAVGGEDNERLQEEMEKVREQADEVTF